MITLAIETSGTSGSVALFKNKKLLATEGWERTASHSEKITVALQILFKAAKLDLKETQRVAVGIGPGSFTGIRVGVNCARSLAYSLQIPCFTMSSLELLAHQVRTKKKKPLRICALQYGFRDILYAATYALDQGRMSEEAPPAALTISELIQQVNSPVLVLGNGYDFLKPLLPPDKTPYFLRDTKYRDNPTAQDFIYTEAVAPSPPHLTDWIHTIPLYIRASEAEEKARTRKQENIPEHSGTGI